MEEIAVSLGSPPRMRGKHNVAFFVQSSIRITPADAGKTKSAWLKSALSPDHPRGCGENAGVKSVTRMPAGSPPRMRGKLRITSDFRNVVGITPADAGKTFRSKFSPREIQDHPRGCGENQSSPNPFHNNIGSPPRMRGKRKNYRNSRKRYRITPADAGKTVCS